MVAQERQGRDRRSSPVALRWPDRRSGFDRRHRTRPGRALASFGARPLAVFAVLAGILSMNVADLLLTLRALDRGAVELNPVMAALFAADPAVAGAFKLTIVAAAVAGLWALRRYRRALEASLAAFAGFVLLLGYHALISG